MKIRIYSHEGISKSFEKMKLRDKYVFFLGEDLGYMLTQGLGHLITWPLRSPSLARSG